MQMKITSYISFFLFAVFFLTTASTIALPFSTTLRWVGSFLLVACFLVKMSITNKTLSINVPSQYKYIFIALVPTLLGVGGVAIFYGYERIISFFLVVFGLQLFFDMNIFSRQNLILMLDIYTILSGCMMILSAFSNRYVQGRLAGVYANANQLSCIAAATIIFALCMFFLKKGRLIRWLYLGIVIVSSYCVFETSSRTGAVCTVLIILFMPFVGVEASSQTRFKQVAMIMMGFIILFLLLKFFEAPGLQRLFDSTTNDSSTGFTRSETWRDVYEIFAEKPLFGWGYGQVSYQVFVNQTSAYNWGIHSSFFVILCEMGIFGSLLFVAFFTSYFLCIKNRIKSKSLTITERTFVKFLLLACFIMLVNAYSESYLFSVGNPMALGFWIPFVMLNVFLNKKKIEDNKETK